MSAEPIQWQPVEPGTLSIAIKSDSKTNKLSVFTNWNLFHKYFYFENYLLKFQNITTKYMEHVDMVSEWATCFAYIHSVVRKRHFESSNRELY